MGEAGIKPSFETPGSWVPAKVQTYFEQAYTATKGDIDAVWVANDFNAASVISVLDKNGKKVPVSGQDAARPGCRTSCSASRRRRSTSRSSLRRKPRWTCR